MAARRRAATASPRTASPTRYRALRTFTIDVDFEPLVHVHVGAGYDPPETPQPGLVLADTVLDADHPAVVALLAMRHGRPPLARPPLVSASDYIEEV